MKRTSCFGPGRRSYNSREAPGQNCSPSGSVISSGVVIRPATGVTSYRDTSVSRANGDSMPYGFARRRHVAAGAGSCFRPSPM
ncbi:hypothetical protein AB0L10_20230 [Streptomyces flaveolus]|uniref:hypothetical protein n=1 Tax=Streptomyces flaveolus TaxID=67297 RepID=UPI003449F9B9